MFDSDTFDPAMFDPTATGRLLSAVADLQLRGYITDEAEIMRRETAGETEFKYVSPLEGHTFDTSEDTPFGKEQNDTRVVLSWWGDAAVIIDVFRAHGFRVEWDGTIKDTIWVWRTDERGHLLAP